ncbi:hypothetical protein BDQ17DRAFT_1434807 [Cyathus striatus]|nr:hypothetical protein BDQ17DRAFT_1434807 [Cyathus striatus]
MKQGQLLYLITFFLRDPDVKSGADIITDLDHVHPVGVFTQQIMSALAVKNTEGEDEKGLMNVLYSHWRISIMELVRAGYEMDLDRGETIKPPEIPMLLVTPPP